MTFVWHLKWISLPHNKIKHIKCEYDIEKCVRSSAVHATRRGTFVHLATLRCFEVWTQHRANRERESVNEKESCHVFVICFEWIRYINIPISKYIGIFLHGEYLFILHRHGCNGNLPLFIVNVQWFTRASLLDAVDVNNIRIRWCSIKTKHSNFLNALELHLILKIFFVVSGSLIPYFSICARDPKTDTRKWECSSQGICTFVWSNNANTHRIIF